MSLKSDLAGHLGRQAFAQVPKLAPLVVGGTIEAIMNQAINGVGKLPGARAAAGRYLQRAHGDVELAIRRSRMDHVGMAGAQGFLTNLGGIVTAIVAMPANFAGLLTVEARSVAIIAHLRGYDIDDSRVRCAMMMCLLGAGAVSDMIKRGDLPTTPLGVATAPVSDKVLQRQIATRVFEALVGGLGGKRAVAFIGKRVPVIGGAVGAANDGYTTTQVGKYAASQFVSRRATVDQAVVPTNCDLDEDEQPATADV